MPRRPRDAAALRLTDAELEIMDALWRGADADVGELVERLGDARAYTTVATLARILEQKRFATSRKVGRRLLYSATISRPVWQRAAALDLLKRAFGGDPEALFRCLLSVEALGLQASEALRAALDARDLGEDPSQRGPAVAPRQGLRAG